MFHLDHRLKKEETDLIIAYEIHAADNIYIGKKKHEKKGKKIN